MKRLIIAAILALFALPLVATAATNPHHAMAKSTAHKVAPPSSIVKITLPGDLSYEYKKGAGQQVAQT